MAPLQGAEVLAATRPDLMAVITTVATVIMAIAVVFGGLRWIFSQGKQNQKHVEALNRNVDATKDLTETVKQLDHRVAIADADFEVKLGRLTDRVTRVEWIVEANSAVLNQQKGVKGGG